jgi:hypothetical protein
MKSNPSNSVMLLLLGLVGSSCLSVLCAAQDFDFFYFVQQVRNEYISDFAENI